MKKRTRCAVLAAGLCALAASAWVVWGQAGSLGKSRSADVEAAQVEAAGLAGDDYEGWNALLAENEISEDFQESLAGFAFQSGSAVLSEAEDNAFFSPLSLYYALAVLGTGAEGETKAELLAALGAEEKEDLIRQCAALFRRYAYQEERAAAEAEAYGESVPDGSLRLANSLWVSEKIKLDSDYRKTCAEDFFASSHAVDFADADTGKRMGEWISEQTNGALAPTVELSPETLLSILNTLYFYGGWQDKFDENQTTEDVFYLENGGEVSVPFMNRTDPMGSFARGDGYTVSGLFTNNDGWVCEACPEGEDGFDYSLRLYPEGEETGYVEVAYAPNYGICGTGMEYKEIELAGKKADAVKDIDAGRWEYIFFEDSDVLVNSWNAGSWFSKNEGQLMEILDTLRF